MLKTPQSKQTHSPLQSSYALARQVEQTYREIINERLINSLERMAHPHYQTQDMPNNFHHLVLQRIVKQMEKEDVQN